MGFDFKQYADNGYGRNMFNFIKKMNTAFPDSYNIVI